MKHFLKRLRRAIPGLGFLVLSFFFHAECANAGCNTPGYPCVVFIAGGGLASEAEIDRSIRDIRQVIGDRADFESFRGTTMSPGIPGLPSIRSFNSSDRQIISNFFENHSGSNVIVITVSAGGAAFHDVATQLGPSFRVGTVYEIEPAFPGVFGRPPSSGSDRTVYIRNDYTGPFGDVFSSSLGIRDPSGSGELYRLNVASYNVSVADDWNIPAAEHGRLAGEWSVMAARLARTQLDHGLTGLRAVLLSAGATYQASRSSPSSGPTISTGTGVPGGGGGGASTVGSESFPIWLSAHDYQTFLRKHPINLPSDRSAKPKQTSGQPTTRTVIKTLE